MSETNPAKYEPNILVDIVDPNKDGHSATWNLVFYGLLFFEVLSVFGFAWSALHTISFPANYENDPAYIENGITIGFLLSSIVWKNVLKSIVIIIFMVLVPAVWYTHAGNQQKLDYNIAHFRFKMRILKGKESFSKYGTGVEPNVFKRILFKFLRIIFKRFHFFANPRDVIIAFTGITHFDRETGMTTEKINKDTEFYEHPYQGDHGFNLLAVPQFSDTDEVIIANFLEAVATLPADHLVSTTMASGHNISYIMDDVEEQLKLPNLSPIREQALWSIYNQFKDRVGMEEPLFIIHIGLPPAVHEYEHVENMRKVRDEFELTLNEIGIETVLIKDPEDLAYIINGLFTGDLAVGRNINEY